MQRPSPLSLGLRLALLALAIISISASAIGQTLQESVITGRVVDASGLPLAGVQVAAKGQTVRDTFTAVTGKDGTYEIGAVPPDAYAVTFDLTGFVTKQLRTRVQASQRITLDATLEIAPIPATVTVVPEPVTQSVDPELPLGTSLGLSVLELLPLDGTMESRITLAPGVTSNGPGGAVTMSGAPSFGNLFLLDGFVINENLRQQPRPFLIADALQETKVAPSAVGTEFGRFQGGIVNTVTKSGGNQLALSFRIGFYNDNWRALTPFGGDRTANHRSPSLEATAGGPLRKNRVFFFGAVKFDNVEQNRTLPYTLINYLYGDRQHRYEAKVTVTPNKRQTARIAYYRFDQERTDAATGSVMDLASLFDDSTTDQMFAGSYTATVGTKTIVEGRYSNRRMTISDAGARSTTLAGAGTPIWDRSRSSARFNSPTGCAVCPGSDDERNNQNLVAKALFTAGAHELTAGLDLFQETRRNDSYQSGSGYRVLATRSAIVNGQVYPVFLADRTTWIYWTPILQRAEGNDLRTYSAFIADNWRLGPRMTLRPGLRYDRNVDRDSQGAQVVTENEFSPRVGFTWNISRDGRWVFNAAVARYATAINSNIADAASSGGRPATYIFDYLGPTVNSTTPTVASPDALKTLFDWFNANGGTTRATRSAPSIPGLTSRISPSLRPPSSTEIAAGFTRALGAGGSIRVDAIYRSSATFYANQRDMTTGKVNDGQGHQYNLLVVTNSSEVTRTYAGINALVSYRMGKLGQINGSYTLSWARGNADGETATSVGPDAAAYTDYPEYRDPAWHSPVGWLAINQRNKLRVWATLNVPSPAWLGRTTAGIVQRIDSGHPYSAVGNINPTAYVVNPGYVTPPTSVPYYFSERGGYHTDVFSATDLSVTITRGFGAKGRTQVFFRGYCNNLFNQSAVVNVSRSVLTRNDNTAYAAFNPFTTQPVLGVNYQYGADFGKPTQPGDYQTPREFSFSVGIRY